MTTSSIDTIYTSIMDNDGLRRLIDAVPSITLVEYRCEGAERGRLRGSKAVAQVLKDLGKQSDVVTTIFLYGRNKKDVEQAAQIESRLFKCAQVVRVYQDWKDVSAEKPLVHNGALILHLTTETGYRKADFVRTKAWNDFVAANRMVYSAAIMEDDTLFEIDVQLKEAITDFVLPQAKSYTQTDFCKERQKELQIYLKTLSYSEAYVRIAQEAQNGCAECNVCNRYGDKHFCPMAQQQIADLFLHGTNAPKSQKLAHQWELKAAKQLYLPAMKHIAFDYWHGRGCEENKEKALGLYKECVQNFADKESCEMIVQLYKEKAEWEMIFALPWMARLAQAGNANYAKAMAGAYREGKYGVKKSVILSVQWENIAARTIETEADLRTYIAEKTAEQQKRLGDDFLYGGNGLEKNAQFARICYIESATKGNVSAQEKLTHEYFYGNNWTKDYKEAVRWGDMALANGSKEVRFNVAYIYAKNRIEVKPDYQKAFRLYTELVEEGNYAAMNNLGCLYGNGELGTLDYEKAFEWYLRAANGGSVVAMDNVAGYYRDGQGCEKDCEKALYWYKRAADLGLLSAMRNLAWCYRNGIGVSKSAEEMKHWYGWAIEKEDDEAMMQLADCYCTGEVVEKNEAEAVRLFAQAAGKGNKNGQYRLGRMYENGVGVDANREKAIYWYRKAAAKGELLAINRLKELNVYYINEQGEFER